MDGARGETELDLLPLESAQQLEINGVLDVGIFGVVGIQHIVHVFDA